MIRVGHALLPALLLAACEPAGPPEKMLDDDWSIPDGGEETGETDSGGGGDSDPPDSADSGDSGDSGGGDYDCAALAEEPEEDNQLEEARAYHGIAFDEEGYLIGWDGSASLVKSTYDGTNQLWLPGWYGVEQLDWLPDGDLVLYASSTAALTRITAEGGSEAITSAVYGIYGVTVGPDGKVWVANGNVYRVDPDSGEVEAIVEESYGIGAHSLAFNLDSTVLYIGTTGTALYALPLDEDLDPAGELELFASVGSGWLDGIELDACGNLYVASYYSSALFRVSPEGEVSTFAGGPSVLYGHGVTWGNGVGGWRTDALYLPQPYNGSTVREVVVGIGGGHEVRTWNGERVLW